MIGMRLEQAVTANHLDRYKSWPMMNLPANDGSGMYYFLPKGDLVLWCSGDPAVVSKAEFWPSSKSAQQRFEEANAGWAEWVKAHTTPKNVDQPLVGCAESRPKPEDVKEFVADPIPPSPSVFKVTPKDVEIKTHPDIADPHPGSLDGYFKDFKVTQKDFEAILRDYYQVEEEHWKNGYSHVGEGDRTGHVVLKDGRRIKWMVRPGGLAWLEFPSGKKMFLVREK
jgi:hypothetical protein